MAKPRIFVSSTYYDLQHIRNNIENFINGFGYEAVLFERGHIPFHHEVPLDESCYNAIPTCHMFVLIIGGRYGSPSSDTSHEIESKLTEYNSVTKKEYERALQCDIPVFIFVERNVYSEYHTYDRNRQQRSINYAYVNSPNIFLLLDGIYSQRRNNMIRPFDNFDEIASWLREQWAGLFADFLSQKKSRETLHDLSTQLKGLRQITRALKDYSESIMRKIRPDEFSDIIEKHDNEIRKANINNFKHDSMIFALFQGYEERRENSSEEIFSAFESATTIDEFVNSLGFPPDHVQDFFDKHRKAAESDFPELKEKYCN